MAGRAFAAAITLNAVIAGQGLAADDIKLAPVIGERPGFGFVKPHQRRFKTHIARHAERDGMIQRFDKFIAAIRIAGKIGLAHAGNHRLRLHLIRVNRGQRQEENIAARHESAWQAFGVRIVIRHRDAVARQAADREFVKQRHIQHFMRPCAQRCGKGAGDINLRPMALAVIERDAMHFIILM